MQVKRLIAISVPIKACNLACHYCYVRAQERVENKQAVFKYDPEHVAKCLTQKRLGGPCIINLTGAGETLLPNEMPDYIFLLLKEGHYLEVVTNGTITKRFDEILKFPKELLYHLEFKFSFHYLELLRLGWIDVFFDNVNRVREAGCSITIECVATDELIPYIDDVKKICIEKCGAICHLTVVRDSLSDELKIMSALSVEEYRNTWSSFESVMFNFKLDLFGKKRKEFCYAGLWSLYVDLGTGMTKPCYGQMCNQNIFKNPNDPIIFRPVGKHCREPYCYNGHAFLALGDIPELNAPSYSEIRNRVCIDGNEWENEDLKEAFSTKFKRTNVIWSKRYQIFWGLFYPFVFVKTALCDIPEIRWKWKEKRRLKRIRSNKK